ncbi:MAG: tRNA (N6-threonylcarbamoyladenosine(37)-N6)-methyltransferase TrmO [Clostridia bacterium]|nr:tRNA (N6-threonylcarbamoyladenosine(37)-N6)-methyltransferase TrmO [Clostridia bacterium]
MKIIARIHCDFKEKFGIPRQSGLVPQTRAKIVFEPEYRNPDALRGIEGYSHLWLIWAFSKAERDTWSPTVRPPRLGGNTRVGVFATRSPFRPNAIGLSSVTLEEVQLHTQDGPVLIVGGADLLDGTPIYDIKPYLPYVDSHPDARGGFGAEKAGYALSVVFPPQLEEKIEEDKREALRGVLENDPRPSYQNDPTRVYGVRFAQYNVKFTVSEGVLTVIGIENHIE